MNNPQKKVRSDPIAWLLEPDNPSVRYLTLRHLLEQSEDDPEVQAARAAIPHSQVVERIFTRQSPDGSWGGSGYPLPDQVQGQLLDGDAPWLSWHTPRGRTGA